MRCPFLIKRRDVYDSDGKKIDEEVELLACMKNECMVYDSATKLCSLLSSNMKTGVLIDDYKKGIKETREELSRSAEKLSEGFLATVEKFEGGMFSRLDVQKKQIEVIILGFDKLQEAFSNKFEELNAGLHNFTEGIGGRLAGLGEVVDKQAEGLRSAVQSLQDTLLESGTAYTRLFGDLLVAVNSVGDRIKDEMSGLKTQNAEAVSSVVAKFDTLGGFFTEMSEATIGRSQALIDKITSIDDAMKSVMNELRFEISTVADRFKDEISGYIEGVKSEIVNLKTGQTGSLNNLQGEVSEVRGLFTRATSSLESMSGMMDNLNKNYLESLGKIAALAEGMRKGVAEIGESVNKSLRDMTGETSNQLGAVAKQYEKTFGTVAKFTDIFEDLNKRLGDMTAAITRQFKESLDRQSSLSGDTKEILESIKTFLQKEAERFDKEREFSRKKTALDHFDRATLYYYRGNYELAQNEIDRALEIDKTAEYLNLKGLILSGLGRYDDSKKAFLSAIKLEPDFSELHNNLGLLYLKMKKIDEAVLSFQESVKKNVNNALAYVNLGKALIEVEKFDEALTAYNKALQIDPSNREAREAINLYKEGKIET
jgi:tetratricopeptide (TPR) repeat protein